MPKIIVKKSAPLRGTVKIDGAKNAVLPIIAATLLAEGKSVIIAATLLAEGKSVLKGVPNLRDVHVISDLLRHLGAEVTYEGTTLTVDASNITTCEAPYELVRKMRASFLVHVISDLLRHLGAEVTYEGTTLTVDASNITTCEAPYELVRKMRASFLVMGPLLARFNHTKISMPGGCAIGTRPIDLHLKGFKSLGAEVEIDHGFVEAKTEKLTGNKLYLDFPSVGATENIMMAAALAEGTTIIENAAEEPEIVDLANFLNEMGANVKGAGTNAAEEPEIVDLANFLNEMGANVKGAGTNTIKIKGVESLKGAEHTVIPDRIEAATYMVAAAMTKGDITVENVLMEHLKPIIAKLRETGCEIIEMENAVRVIGPKRTYGTLKTNNSKIKRNWL